MDTRADVQLRVCELIEEQMGADRGGVRLDDDLETGLNLDESDAGLVLDDLEAEYGVDFGGERPWTVGQIIDHIVAHSLLVAPQP